MSQQRSHCITTSDGVTIGGTVHGQGPPLVFLHGVIGDGDTDWQPLLGHLTDQFTVYLPSYRGRGLSGDHPDHSIGRIIEDVVAYVDSIGEPTGLVGWSLGAAVALAVATQSDAVTAAAVYEPVVPELLDEQQQQALAASVGQMAELTARGDLTAAARAFARWPFGDRDVAAADSAGYFEATGRYTPVLLKFFQQQADSEGPRLSDPALLGAISTPVLVLHGADTKPFYTDVVRHLAEHVPNARVHEIPGVGHATPLTHPGALAEALAEFFDPARQPA